MVRVAVVVEEGTREPFAMIKFTGLILICAASALALLLPALGVVKFPMVSGMIVPGTIVPGTSQVNPPSLSETNVGLPPTIPQATIPQAAIPQAVPPGLLTGTNVAGTPAAASDSGPILFGPPWTKQKVGLNVWLLLGPVLVIGLVMWTFAPNRSGLGR